MMIDSWMIAVLRPEELITIIFCIVTLSIIVLFLVLSRRERPMDTETPVDLPVLPPVNPLNRRQMDILQIYDDAIPVAPPPHLSEQPAVRNQTFVRRTAKVRDRRSGNVFLTRVVLPEDSSH
ncbi:MAG: hypothetical protein JJT96_06625 [Opitutales bacterium]|nr:hypothetical protein [Opitutales bacterium]